LTTKEKFEIGLITKDWSREKAGRDLKKITPNYLESEMFNGYLD